MNTIRTVIPAIIMVSIWGYIFRKLILDVFDDIVNVICGDGGDIDECEP